MNSISDNGNFIISTYRRDHADKFEVDISRTGVFPQVTEKSWFLEFLETQRNAENLLQATDDRIIPVFRSGTKCDPVGVRHPVASPRNTQLAVRVFKIHRDATISNFVH